MNRFLTFAEIGKKLLPLAAFGVASVTAAADTTEIQSIGGYFCDAKADQISLLTRQARGENEIIAADAVNKSLARQSCAYYLPVSAIHSRQETVFADGLVFKLEGYVFLPEKVERWSGTAMGSLQEAPHAQDI